MYVEEQNSINRFWTIGINYRKADTSSRGQYAINIDQYEKLLSLAPNYGINDVFVLSTCNRTEIYGMCEQPSQLIELLCDHTVGAQADFEAHAYKKNAHDAILHLYNVAAGLDSQILGDYEIIAQLKEAIKISTNNNKCGIFLNRLFQSTLQSARDIRSKTKLSSGTVSVAFAAIQYLKSVSSDIAQENIVIIGSGKMGVASCKNLIQLTGGKNITLINRTFEKAQTIAKELGVKAEPLESLQKMVDQASVIIVATNASEPILQPHHFKAKDKKVLIDLSIPHNIDPIVGQNPAISLVNVDELSKINDETLKMRMGEIPKAKNIINFHIHQFAEWYLMQKNVPYLKVMKETLKDINKNYTIDQCPYAEQKLNVQSVVNDMAEKMKENSSTPGCTYIETLSTYLSSTKIEQV